MSRLNDAVMLATGAHAGQRYGAGADYTVHLAAVEGVLRRFGVEDEDLLVAAWLHDILEDTFVSAREVQRLFGDRVLGLVTAVTNEPGKNRKERHERTYPKLKAAGPSAIILKLADRIANVEASLQDISGGKLSMYRKEHPAFRSALILVDASPGSLWAQMWGHLDNLMERIVVVKEPDSLTRREGLPPEPCCFCEMPTAYWTARDDKGVTGKDVACCMTCATKHTLSEVPTKEQWMGRTA